MQPSATDEPLLSLLQDLSEALADMPASELAEFTFRWHSLAHRALRADYTHGELVANLRELLGAFPTLGAHKLDQVLQADVLIRYSINPVVPPAPKPDPVPVRNEIVRRIWQLYDSLVQRPA